MAEKEEVEGTRTRQLIFDAVITFRNQFDVLKKMAYCLKTKGEAKIGMTRGNEWRFNEIVDTLKDFGIILKEIKEFDYKVGIHNGECNGVCKLVVLENHRNN